VAPASADASAAVTSWHGSTGVGGPLESAAAGADETGAAGAALDDATLAEADRDAGALGVDDAVADDEAVFGSTTFGGAVAACFVDLQPLTNKTEHIPTLRTAVCRRIFVPSLVA
jgi:hypothetical protein